MNAMKAFVSTCVALVLLAGTSSRAADADAKRLDEQVAFGLKEVQRILDRDASTLAEFGLQDRGDLQKLQVGAPIEAFRLDPKGLEAYAPGQKIAPLLTPMEELYYPVLVNGKTRLVLWLAKLEGTWQFAGFGQADLGAALSGLTARYAKGAKLKVVLQAQTQAKLLLVEQAGAEKVFYLSSHPWSFNAAIRSDLTELRQPELMEQLREATRQMLRN